MSIFRTPENQKKTIKIITHTAEASHFQNRKLFYSPNLPKNDNINLRIKEANISVEKSLENIYKFSEDPKIPRIFKQKNELKVRKFPKKVINLFKLKMKKDSKTSVPFIRNGPYQKHSRIEDQIDKIKNLMVDDEHKISSYINYQKKQDEIHKLLDKKYQERQDHRRSMSEFEVQRRPKWNTIAPTKKIEGLIVPIIRSEKRLFTTQEKFKNELRDELQKRRVGLKTQSSPQVTFDFKGSTFSNFKNPNPNNQTCQTSQNNFFITNTNFISTNPQTFGFTNNNFNKTQNTLFHQIQQQQQQQKTRNNDTIISHFTQQNFHKSSNNISSIIGEPIFTENSKLFMKKGYSTEKRKSYEKYILKACKAASSSSIDIRNGLESYLPDAISKPAKNLKKRINSEFLISNVEKEIVQESMEYKTIKRLFVYPKANYLKSHYISEDEQNMFKQVKKVDAINEKSAFNARNMILNHFDVHLSQKDIMGYKEDVKMETNHFDFIRKYKKILNKNNSTKIKKLLTNTDIKNSQMLEKVNEILRKTSNKTSVALI
jgi:hypothetical protein